MAEQIKIPVLEKLKANLRNPSQILKYIASDLLFAVNQNFDKEGRPRWQKLSKRTIAERKRLGFWPGKILQRTGELKRSITSGSDNSSAWVGTNKSYAALHQFGGQLTRSPRSSVYIQNRRKSGSFKKGTTPGKGYTYKSSSIKIPARPFLSVTKQDLDKIKKHFATALTQ